MRRLLIIIVVMLLVLAAAGCQEKEGALNSDNTRQSEEETVTVADNVGSEEFSQMLSDWILGTDYGITDIRTDSTAKRLVITISGEKQSALQDFDYEDVAVSVSDMLAHSGVDADGYVLEWPDGRKTALSSGTVDIANMPETVEQTQGSENAVVGGTNEDAVNLIFIHHSVGENWLNDGLNQMLNENGYHVADTYYGWDDMGDRTDTTDWPDWFNEDYMPRVYVKLNTETATNTIEAAPGENEIVMFKSCFPNSEVGGSISDEQAIYKSLLEYFGAHPDKMFILITSPPMQHISKAKNTRELANWLVSKDGWLADYNTGNVFVFDLYNVLTAPGNHHYFDGTKEVHEIGDSSNELYYDSGGDDHPNTEGNRKAAEEFVTLLNYWYGQFKDR